MQFSKDRQEKPPKEGSICARIWWSKRSSRELSGENVQTEHKININSASPGWESVGKRSPPCESADSEQSHSAWFLRCSPMGRSPLTHLRDPIVYCCVGNHSKTEWHKAVTGVLCSLVLWVRNSAKTQLHGVWRPLLGRAAVLGGDSDPWGTKSSGCLLLPMFDVCLGRLKDECHWDYPPAGLQHGSLRGGGLLAQGLGIPKARVLANQVEDEWPFLI